MASLNLKFDPYENRRKETGIGQMAEPNVLVVTIGDLGICRGRVEHTRFNNLF